MTHLLVTLSNALSDLTLMKGIDQTWILLNQAGEVTLPLLGCAVVIYYWLGYRLWVLWIVSPRTLIQQRRILSRSLQDDLSVFKRSSSLLEGTLESISQQFKLDLNRGIHLLEVAVVCSPLLGLLGTVSGMMTTFDSLGDQSLLSQASVGVAAGISEALFSTQLGLIISIPGLLLGRLLQKKQRNLETQIDEMCSSFLHRFALSSSPSQEDSL